MKGWVPAFKHWTSAHKSPLATRSCKFDTDSYSHSFSSSHLILGFMEWAVPKDVTATVSDEVSGSLLLESALDTTGGIGENCGSWRGPAETFVSGSGSEWVVVTASGCAVVAVWACAVVTSTFPVMAVSTPGSWRLPLGTEIIRFFFLHGSRHFTNTCGE